MPRIQPKKSENADPKVKEMYQGFQDKLGRIPNIFLNMGNSPAVLKAYISLNEAVEQTSLDPQLREKIALTIGQTNRCNYCLSAHTAIAKGIGVQEQDILDARGGQASDPKSKAILKFVRTAVDKRGQVNDQEVEELKKAGVSDQELTEIVLLITINMFTNYFNLITGTSVDFPQIPELQTAR